MRTLVHNMKKNYRHIKRIAPIFFMCCTLLLFSTIARGQNPAMGRYILTGGLISFNDAEVAVMQQDVKLLAEGGGQDKILAQYSGAELAATGLDNTWYIYDAPLRPYNIIAFMYKEYKDVSPWICVGGYMVATTTGALRIANRAHWLSDVIMGAGIGLLSVEIGYMLLPVWRNILGVESHEQCFAAVPLVGAKSLGIGIIYQF